MWIFTNKGFISIVRHNRQPDMLLVRARDRETLVELFPGLEISTTIDADYRFRVIVEEGKAASRIWEMVEQIDYPNFKNSIPPARSRYHSACMDVWETMHRYQAEGD